MGTIPNLKMTDDLKTRGNCVRTLVSCSYSMREVKNIPT